MGSEHVRDESRLSKCVTGWKPIESEMTFECRDQLILAIPVMDGWGGWYYEYAVVEVDADEDHFNLIGMYGETWDGDIHGDADFYAILGAAVGPKQPGRNASLRPAGGERE